MKNIRDLIAQARPIDDSDWSSERQVNAENAVFEYVASILTREQFEALENYCLKATADERLDAALSIVKGDVKWLTKWL